MSTIQRWLADGACSTVLTTYGLDFISETELRIQAKELLRSNVSVSHVMNDKKSWFTCMIVLDLIYHQFFFTTNCLVHQPTTSQICQPVTPGIEVLAAADIHYMLSEYATGKKVMVMFSQDRYPGKFCPSTVIDLITGEDTALIRLPLVSCIIPLLVLLCYGLCSSIPISAPHLDQWINISFQAHYPFGFQLACTRMSALPIWCGFLLCDGHFFSRIGTPAVGGALLL